MAAKKCRARDSVIMMNVGWDPSIVMDPDVPGPVDRSRRMLQSHICLLECFGRMNPVLNETRTNGWHRMHGEPVLKVHAGGNKHHVKQVL
jgi:hypothetical protein